MKDSSLLLKKSTVRDSQQAQTFQRTQIINLSNPQCDKSVYENAGSSSASIQDSTSSTLLNLTYDQTLSSEHVAGLGHDKCYSGDLEKHANELKRRTQDDNKLYPSEQAVFNESGKNKGVHKGVSAQEGSKVVENAEMRYIPPTHFAIGLLVLCCFNLPFGLVALYFSLQAAAAYRDGNNFLGAWRARTSIVLSLVGIMLTMMVVSSAVVYIAVNKHNDRKVHKRLSSSGYGF